MGSLRKRYAVLEAVAMKMLEENKVLTKHEYDNCKSVPIRSALVLNHFNNWSRLINIMRVEMPEVFDQIEGQKAPPVVIPKKTSKEDALAALAKKKKTENQDAEKV